MNLDDRIDYVKLMFADRLQREPRDDGRTVRFGLIARDGWPLVIDGLRVIDPENTFDSALAARQGITYPMLEDNEFLILYSPEVFAAYPTDDDFVAFVMVWATRLLVYTIVYDAHPTDAERERAVTEYLLNNTNLSPDLIDFPHY